MQNQIMREALNARQASQVLGISMPTMLALLSRGEMPAVRVGRRWVIPRDSLTAWMKEQAEARAVIR